MAFKDFICLFFERGEGRETEKETTINVWESIHWLPLAQAYPGTWPVTQACALTSGFAGGCPTHWATPARAHLHPLPEVSLISAWVGTIALLACCFSCPTEHMLVKEGAMPYVFSFPLSVLCIEWSAEVGPVSSSRSFLFSQRCWTPIRHIGCMS